ncbi:hypothetical protein JYK22_21675, partial [Nonomuraea sp. RK-328]|nr:hypothetical protein [Nonomuraea sp. RK-328]
VSKKPYAAALADVPAEQPLTDNSANELNTLLQQTDGNRKRIIGLREAQERKIREAKAEIESLNRLIGLLDSTADLYRMQLGQPPRVLPLQVVQDLRQVSEMQHRQVWDGSTPPETDMFATVPDLSPNADRNIEHLVEQWDAQDEREGGAE